jgi:tetratricopeptide repeat protein
MARKKCFVLMGFGVKTDYRTQRVLDLDKTYRIIKTAVEAAGLDCIRADDLVHSGVIDKPMYEHLLEADVAIADLSTSNENAIYELGVRHALRPQTTIVLAEKQFKFPFDVSHVVIRTYEHLGSGIDFEEALRLQGEITKALQELLSTPAVDSPVYTFLPTLQPPHANGVALAGVLAAPAAPRPAAAEPVRPAAADPGAGDAAVFSALLDAFHAARKKGDFASAKALVERLRQLHPGDPYLIQQHAFCTYKCELPGVVESLAEATRILAELDPAHSSDPETLGMWSAVHKHLWEERGSAKDLEEALRSSERGFFLKRDYYSGVNYAFLLDVRARLQRDEEEATADRVMARRVRRQLLDITQAALVSLPRKEDTGEVDGEEAYWLRATRVEALMGLGDNTAFQAARAELIAQAPEQWMVTTTEAQLAKLRVILGSPLPVA